MTPPEALAARLGIEASFVDAHGETRTTSAATRRRLLDAMRVGHDEEAALAALERADWARGLPFVRVACNEPGPVTIEVIQPAGCSDVTWQLTLEDGGTRSGRARIGELETRGEAMLDGVTRERRILILPADLPQGYHRLRLIPGGDECSLIVTPARCWLPADGRGWGVTTQLYLMRSDANWGIGDFSDLQHLVRLVAPRGASVIGLNPLHAMFADRPEHASPYSPASRLLLNVLNIDVTAVSAFATSASAQALVASASFQANLAACRAARLVDYAGVAELKLQVLALLFNEGAVAHDPAFDEFRRRGGAVLERTCVFQALREHLARSDAARADWQDWPADYHDPDGAAVATFAEDHAERVTFRVWLQFLADAQLGCAAAAARAAGMAIGLYRDLAVGADRGGAETWSNPRAVVSGAQVGAPPDIHNPAGQDWGLPPFHPWALREEGYRSFIDLVRANMRHAGGLRIDHVMALQHLYWVPRGCSPAEGAYVAYPIDDLVGILALESRRHSCLVVGEDLGTVPDGFRERMAAANILSYRVLFFEQDKRGDYLPPGSYPALSLSVAGSHDLPTLRGWWDGTDIDLKQGLGLYPAPDEAVRQHAQRALDRSALLAAFRREGLLATEADVTVDIFVDLAHAFLARTRSMLAMAQIDDITCEVDPVNVPATSDQHPNWRRRLSLTLEALAASSRLDPICKTLAAERGPRTGRTIA